MIAPHIHKRMRFFREKGGSKIVELAVDGKEKNYPRADSN